MSIQTLATPSNVNILGSYGASISIRFDEIPRDFGGGYDETELTGPTGGLLVLKLNYDFLTDTTELTVIDTENSSTVTPWARYIWLFFKRRKADQAAFYATFTDPGTGAAVSTKQFKFIDSQLDYNAVTFKLYSTGLMLREYVPLV